MSSCSSGAIGRAVLLQTRMSRSSSLPFNATEEARQRSRNWGIKSLPPLSLSVKDFYERESVLVPHPADDACCRFIRIRGLIFKRDYRFGSSGTVHGF